MLGVLVLPAAGEPQATDRCYKSKFSINVSVVSCNHYISKLSLITKCQWKWQVNVPSRITVVSTGCSHKPSVHPQNSCFCVADGYLTIIFSIFPFWLWSVKIYPFDYIANLISAISLHSRQILLRDGNASKSLLSAHTQKKKDRKKEISWLQIREDNRMSPCHYYGQALAEIME